MTVRSIRASKNHVANGEQDKLLDDLLAVFDKHRPFRTLDALEVLTVMAATLVTTHARDRYCAESIMHQVVMKMDKIIREELWLEEQADPVRH